MRLWAAAPFKRKEEYYLESDEPMIEIKYRVRLRRRPLYYIIYMILPTTVISFMSLLAFLLPSDSGEKIGLGLITNHYSVTLRCCSTDRQPCYGVCSPCFPVLWRLQLRVCSVKIHAMRLRWCIEYLSDERGFAAAKCLTCHSLDLLSYANSFLSRVSSQFHCSLHAFNRNSLAMTLTIIRLSLYGRPLYSTAETILFHWYLLLSQTNFVLRS